MPTNGTLRIAALADLHFSKSSRGTLQPVFTAVAESADVLLVCGDLTHHGRAAEAEILANELSALRIPVIAVLGNHDFHSGEQAEIEKVLENVGVRVLDGDIEVYRNVGFAGIKGFTGGFGRYMLEPWGEDSIKGLVHEAVGEQLKLDAALARLTTHHRIVLLHYAPIADTVEGEPREIYPFLGSGRLEEPINRFKVTAVFHGHAHHGRSEGVTSQGIPVYNVSMPLMNSHGDDSPGFRVLELPIDQPAAI
jgi:Icc-related predicted phosphoesterase